MKKTLENLNILTVIFVVTLVIANVVTGKIINTNIILFGNIVTIPGAIICYPITYLITDIVGEIWGKSKANDIVRYGFIGQIVGTLIIMVTKYTPYLDIDTQKAYIKLLGQNWIFVIGSLVAYLISQHVDVVIFHKLRDYFISTNKNVFKYKWIWNNASTIISQFIDTLIFIIIAFGFGFGWLFNNQFTLINMLIGQYFVKFIIALLDTPIFYILTRKH